MSSSLKARLVWAWVLGQFLIQLLLLVTMIFAIDGSQQKHPAVANFDGSVCLFHCLFICSFACWLVLFAFIGV